MGLGLAESVDNYAFLDGGGEMGALMRAFDWTKTPLGPLHTWPRSLKTATSICLRSPVAIVMLWGEPGVMIYNDAYSVFAGGRHPRLLGSNVREGWPEVADFNDNIVKVVGMGGGTLSYRDIVLSLNRTGQFEDVYLDLDYSPIPDDDGKPGGVIAIVIEITERVMAERARETERERLVQLFEQAPGFICTMRGPDHVYEFVNAAHRRLFNSESWIGKPLREAFPDIEGQGFYEAMDRVYATGEQVVFNQVPVAFRAGPEGERQTRVLDFVYAPMVDEKGEVTGIFCEGADVTEQARTQTALRNSQERLQLALDAADMGTFIWFPQEDRTEGDAQMLALFGFTRNEQLNLARALAHSIDPADTERYAAAVARACDPFGLGILQEDIRVHPPIGGPMRWLRVTGQVYFGGEPAVATRMAGAVVDITEAKLAESALRASEQRLRFLDDLSKETAKHLDADEILSQTTRMVGQHLSVSICAYADMDEDEDGFTIRGDWSAEGSTSIVGHYSLRDFGALAVKRLGAGLPLIVNDSRRELAPDEAAAFEAIGVSATVCVPLVKDGRLTALMAIHDRQPRHWTAGELAVLADVTERSWAHIERIRAEADLRESAAALSELNTTLEQRVDERTGQLLQAQAALHQSQKMETVGQLTGGVAHDFNNLLMPIVGALDMLRGRLADDERAQRLTNAGLQAADRAQTLVQRLLAFSRRQHLMPRAVDVQALIESMADLVSRSLGPRIQLNLEVEPGLPPAHVDPNQLELALLNLAVNARDAMGGEGTLTIRAARSGPGEISGVRLAGYIQISVADTGVGMDEETLKRAVEPFYTTKGVGRGTGLGLSSVQGLAEQSGGAFQLTSKPGDGATATLWLPVSSEALPRAASSAPASGPRPGRSATILLVDDEELVRAGTADMLAEAGFVVQDASSGYRAVEMLKRGFRPDVVVTDYAMPGMTGAELAREVRASRPGVPVLLITGYATLSDREAGDLPRLPKPFRQADLVAAVDELLAKATA